MGDYKTIHQNVDITVHNVGAGKVTGGGKQFDQLLYIYSSRTI